MRKEVVLFLLVSVAITKSQNIILPPKLSPVLEQLLGRIYSFLDLWFLSIKVDGRPQPPSNQANLEPKTLLLPDDFSMTTLVPLGATNPLYLKDEKHSELRRKFILDHLIMNPLPKNDTALDSPSGLKEKTLSNKPVTIRRKKSGDLYVEGIRVKKTVTLLPNAIDGIQIYVLECPLFNQTQIVRQAFYDLPEEKRFTTILVPTFTSSAPATASINSRVFYLFCLILILKCILILSNYFHFHIYNGFIVSV